MEYKASESYIKAIEDRTVTGIAAVFGNVDDGGDRLHRGAFKKTLKESASRVRHLWQHDASLPPIAAIKSLREVTAEELPEKARAGGATGGLEVVREYLRTPRADEILEGIKAGAINEMSFAYEPIKFDFEELATDDGKRLVRNLREVRLWDASDVNWGMNALTAAAKSALPFADAGVAAEGAEWAAPRLSDFTDAEWADLSDAEKRRIASHYAWAGAMPPDAFEDLKLPHHQPAKAGVGPAVWAGVKAAMGALMGARGGVDLPEGDRRSVYTHLAKHYSQFDAEPPDYKWLVLVEAIEGLEGYAGESLLDLKGMGDLLGIHHQLKRILAAAEPPDRALTARLQQRLKLAERELTLRR